MKREIIEKIDSLITVAVGFIVALAWNSAILGIFNKYYAEEIVPLLIYAVLITIIAVVLTVWIGRISKKNSKKKEKK